MTEAWTAKNPALDRLMAPSALLLPQITATSRGDAYRPRNAAGRQAGHAGTKLGGARDGKRGTGTGSHAPLRVACGYCALAVIAHCVKWAWGTHPGCGNGQSYKVPCFVK